MDVTQTIEISALHLIKQSKFGIAKFLSQNISKIVSKDINRKHKNNQNIIEGKVITKKKKNQHEDVSTWYRIEIYNHKRKRCNEENKIGNDKIQNN